MRPGIALLLGLLLLSPCGSDARTWWVRQDGSGDCTSIQACCDSAGWYDTVLVGPGTYLEHVDVWWVNLLKSEAGALGTVISAPSGYHPVLATSRPTVVDGFTIRDGTTWELGAGGVYIAGGVLRNCLIVNNVHYAMDTYGAGGGVAAALDAAIEGNTIVFNGKWPYLYMEGAGIYCFESFTGTIARNIIVQNRGGGIFCEPGAAPTILCNNVWGNAWENYRGACGDQTGVNGNISVDPLFCAPENGDFTLCVASPCLDAPGCGQMGVFGVGCSPTAVTATTWGRIKVLFR